MTVNTYDWIPPSPFFLYFAMSWTHRTIYRKVTVQTGYVGAGESSGLLVPDRCGGNKHVFDDACLCRSKVNTFS